MFGYYTSLLNTYKKKISLYIVLLVMILSFVGLIILLALTRDYFYSVESYYVLLTPIVSFLFMPIFWFMFYNNIYKNLNKSNLEMLSFSVGLSRAKIFFAKALVFLTLAFILSIISAILIVIPTYVTYKNNAAKIIQAIFGTILVGTFGGWAFYFFVFFIDTLTKNPKRKRSLAWAPLTVVLSLAFIPFVVNSILGSTVKSDHYVGKGFGDFQDSRYTKNNFQESDYISTSENETYYDGYGDIRRDVGYYNKQTAIVKGVGVFTNYLNLKNILEKAQGIEKTLSKDSYYDYTPFDQPIFNYHQGVDLSFFNDIVSINVKHGNTTEKIYLKHQKFPWENRWNDHYLQETILAYQREIEELVTKLKNYSEFNKNEINFNVLQNFLVKEMNIAFSKPEFQKEKIYPQENFESKKLEGENQEVFPNYPMDSNRMLSYIYTKAEPKNKTLVFDYVLVVRKIDSWTSGEQYIDSKGDTHFYYHDYNFQPYDYNNPEEVKKHEERQKKREEEQKLYEEARSSRQFLDNYTNPQKIFASRELTSDYEYPWINWVLIVVVILGIGYWSLERYDRRDIA